MDVNSAPVEGAEGGEVTTDAETAGESTSAEEVASVLGLPTNEATEDDSEHEEVAQEEAETAEEGQEAESQEQEKVEEELTPETPADTVEAEVPNFNLEVEDANGNKVVIQPGANLEEVLANFEPKNNGQVFQIIKDVMRLEGEKNIWETQQQEEAKQAEYAQRVADVQAAWDSEITKLQGEKRLPVDGKIEERKGEVYTFIAKENAERAKEGRPLIQSFEDALDKLELRESKESAAQAAKDAKDTARKNGGLVGGSSAPASPGTAAYQAGSARNIDEALRATGLLR